MGRESDSGRRKRSLTFVCLLALSQAACGRSETVTPSVAPTASNSPLEDGEPAEQLARFEVPAHDAEPAGTGAVSAAIQPVDAATQSGIPIGQAIRDRHVEVRITGVGGSTGDTILITARRKVPDDIRLILTPGTVFSSVSGNVQNMVAASIKGERVGENSYRSTRELVLADEDEHSYIIEAYCLNFHKANPGPSDSFTVAPADERATKILRAGKKRSASIQAIQSALWIERDRVSAQELQARFPVKDEDVEVARELVREAERSN